MDFDLATMKRNIGIKIAYYRRQRDMSQKELADILGIEQQHVSSMERGIMGISLQRILKISEALQIKPYLLFYHDDILANGEIEPKISPIIKD